MKEMCRVVPHAEEGHVVSKGERAIYRGCGENTRCLRGIAGIIPLEGLVHGGLTENDFILAAKINGLNLHHLLRKKAAA
ncbi:hypothetical protein NC651_026787 [Populus alba x Populus x berolinensis]|nr:hypothetical protein NC651_026787 [Populus alba x Populus x berolinensis]